MYRPLPLLLAALGLAHAQAPSGLPECSQPAFLAAIQASGCSATDKACVCGNKALLSSLADSVEEACSQADQAALSSFAGTYCASVTAAAATPAAASATSDSTSSGDANESGDSSHSGDVAPAGSSPGDSSQETTSLAIVTTTADDPSVTDATLTAVSVAATGLPTSIGEPETTVTETDLISAVSETPSTTLTTASIATETLTHNATIATASSAPYPTNTSAGSGAAVMAETCLAGVALAIFGVSWALAEVIH